MPILRKACSTVKYEAFCLYSDRNKRVTGTVSISCLGQ